MWHRWTIMHLWKPIFLWSTIKLTFQRRVKCDGYHVLKALPGLRNNFQLWLSQTAYVQRWNSERSLVLLCLPKLPLALAAQLRGTILPKGFSVRLCMPGRRVSLLMESGCVLLKDQTAAICWIFFTTAAENNCWEISIYSSIQMGGGIFDLLPPREYQFPPAVWKRNSIIGLI